MLPGAPAPGSRVTSAPPPGGCTRRVRPCKRRLKETKPTFLQAHGLPGPVREVRSRREPGIQEKNVFVVCFLGNAFWVVAKSCFQSAEPVVRAGSDPRTQAGENPQHIPFSPGQAAPCPFCSAFQTRRKIAPGMLVGPSSPRMWGPRRRRQVLHTGEQPPSWSRAHSFPRHHSLEPELLRSHFQQPPTDLGSPPGGTEPTPQVSEVLSPGTCKTSAAGAGSMHRG